MTRVLGAAGVLWYSAGYQMAIVRSHPLVLVGGVLQPAVLILVIFYARGQPTGEQVVGVATAVMLMAYWHSTVWQGAAILRRERAFGTLAASMRSVHDPLLVLTGKALGASLLPGVLAAATVIATLALLGQPVAVAAPGWFAVGLLAALVSGTALGTLLCGLFLLTRYGLQLSGALLYPVFLLAGLLIPASYFPPAIRWIGWLVNLRWVQDFLVSSAGGTPNFAALGVVGLLTVGYSSVGVLAYRHIDTLARARGTLELG